MNVHARRKPDSETSFSFIIYFMHCVKIIVFNNKKIKFLRINLSSIISSKFYKYAIHSSFTHMLNMGQLRVQIRRYEHVLFSPTRGLVVRAKKL